MVLLCDNPDASFDKESFARAILDFSRMDPIFTDPSSSNMIMKPKPTANEWQRRPALKKQASKNLSCN